MARRQFVAVAMPQGDAARGLRGPGVLLSVREEGVAVDFYWIDHAEAIALRRQLESAELALMTGAMFKQERIGA